MEISFTDLKQKEVVNIFDGKKLGRIIDILFENSTGTVKGVIVPGEKKFLRRGDDVFIPLDLIKKIGDDVILVKLNLGGSGYVYGTQNYVSSRVVSPENAGYGRYYYNEKSKIAIKGQSQSNIQEFARYRRLKKWLFKKRRAKIKSNKG